MQRRNFRALRVTQMKFSPQPLELPVGSLRDFTKIACSKEISPTKSNQCGGEGADCGENQPIPDASTFVHARWGRLIGHISLLSISSFLRSPEMTQRVRTLYLPNVLQLLRKSQVVAHAVTER